MDQSMQVSVETTAGLERKVRISVSAEQFELRVDSRLREAAKSVRIDGFRQGKIPMKEVRRRFGHGVRHEVANELMQSSFVEAVTQENLSPAGAPSLEVVNLNAGADLEYTATFEVFPDVGLKPFDGVSVERPIAQVDHADIDTAVQALREQHQDWVAEEGHGAESGDRLNIDFQGSMGGEPFEGSQASDFTLFLGMGRMVEGFEEGLMGLKAGAETTLEVDFPEDYGSDELAGKRVEFQVTVNDVVSPRLPELDEDFFSALGIEEGGEEALREQVRERLERELSGAIKSHIKQQVMNGLAGLHEFQLPESLIAAEIKGLRSNFQRQLAMGDSGQADPQQFPDDMFRPEAERRVKLGLVIQAVVAQRELAPDPDRVRNMVEELAAGYEQPEQVVNWYYNNEEQLSQIRSMALEEQVVELILAEAVMTDVERSYEEVMHRGHDHQSEDGDSESPDSGE